MADTSYEQLRDALVQVETVLGEGVEVLGPAVVTLTAMFSRIGEFLDALLAVLGELKAAMSSAEPDPALKGEILLRLDGVTNRVDALRAP